MFGFCQFAKAFQAVGAADVVLEWSGTEHADTDVGGHHVGGCDPQLVVAVDRHTGAGQRQLLACQRAFSAEREITAGVIGSDVGGTYPHHEIAGFISLGNGRGRQHAGRQNAEGKCTGHHNLLEPE